MYDIRTYLGYTPKTYVEIGSYIGSSASLIKNNQIQPKYVSPHYFIPKLGITVDVNLNVISPGLFNENIIDISNNCINHYWCKSYEDWKNKCDICHSRGFINDGKLRGS